MRLPCSPCSYVLYLWYSSLLRLGFRRTLQYEDVWDVPAALKTGHVEPRFAAEFKRQKALAAALPDGKVRLLMAALLLLLVLCCRCCCCRRCCCSPAFAVAEKPASCPCCNPQPPPPTSILHPQGAAVVKAAEEGQTSRLVLRSIFFCHWPRLLAALCLQLFYSGLQFAGPLFLNQIVKFISSPPALQTVRGWSSCVHNGMGRLRRGCSLCACLLRTRSLWLRLPCWPAAPLPHTSHASHLPSAPSPSCPFPRTTASPSRTSLRP